MNRVPYIFAALLVLAAASLQAAYARERTPPGSFLRYRAVSVSQLVNEVRTDPVARARFSRHFGVPEDQVAEYFASRLKLVSLTAPLKVKVWFIGKGGAVYSKQKLLPKGTPIFVTHEGTPLILWSCGNPLRAALPEALFTEEEPAKPEPVEAVEVKPAPIEAIAAAAVSAVPAPTTAAVLPAAIPVATDVAATATVSAAPPFLGGLGVLSLLGGLVARGHDPTPWVPEPSGMAALGTALVGLPTLVLFKKRQK